MENNPLSSTENMISTFYYVEILVFIKFSSHYYTVYVFSIKPKYPYSF